jgi:hypothetical protein
MSPSSGRGGVVVILARLVTTVPFHPGRDNSPSLLRQIASDVGLTVREFFADALARPRQASAPPSPRL